MNMDRINEPVFLIGAERSGTTLLRLMLDHHPEIAFNLESEYLVSQIAEDGVFPDIGHYADWLRCNRVFRHSRFDIDERLDYAGLVNDFLRQKLERDGKKYVGATVHYQFGKLPLIWPDAKYIYLYRDGRDVANSVVQMGWAGNVFVAADWWLEAEKEWESLRAGLARDHWTEVRYEDLVANPRGELENLCGFFGTGFSERMFDYTKNGSYGLPDARLIYRWQGKKPYDVQLAEARMASSLQERGYELSGLPLKTIGPVSGRILRLHSRLAGSCRRVSDFGLALYLEEILARRLGLKQWNRAVQDKIDTIVDAGIR